MKDLTQGSIFRHILAMAGPIAAGMLLQTLYYIVGLTPNLPLGRPMSATAVPARGSGRQRERLFLRAPPSLRNRCVVCPSRRRGSSPGITCAAIAEPVNRSIRRSASRSA